MSPLPLCAAIWGRFMDDHRKWLVAARRDPLTAGERLAVSAAVVLVFEGVGEPPRETMLHWLKTGLPSLRSDADFAALAAAGARLLAAESYPEKLIAMAHLSDALRPILLRDFSFALRDAAGEVRDAG